MHRGFLAARTADGAIGIAHGFCPQIGFLIHIAFAQAFLHGVEVGKLMQEEHVDLRQRMKFLQGNAPANGLIDGVHPLVGAPANQLHQRLIGQLAQFLHPQGVAADFRAAHSLHQGLLHAHADGHHLASGLHLRAQSALAVHKLIKGPLRQLGHNIVQRRFKAGAGLAGNGIAHFIQGIPDGDLRGALGDGIPGSLGCQGRGATHPGIDLNNRVLKAVRVQGKLAVAAALHLQGRNDVQGGPAQHLIFLVRQGQRRGHHDGVAGMHTYRVNVLHGAHRHYVAQAVPHDLKLDFLPPGNAALHQNLGNGRQAQAVFGNLLQFRAVLADTAAAAAQGVCRAHNDRIADFLRKGQRVGDILHHLAGDTGLADGFHGFLEFQPVLRLLDGFTGSAQELDPVGIQEALLGQLHGQGQAVLAAQGGQQAVRLFLQDNAPDGFQGQRLNVNFIRGSPVGHDGGRVRVHQDNLQPCLLQRTASLRAGIVKLGGLPDDDGTGADNHYAVQFRIQRHW